MMQTKQLCLNWVVSGATTRPGHLLTALQLVTCAAEHRTAAEPGAATLVEFVAALVALVAALVALVVWWCRWWCWYVLQCSFGLAAFTAKSHRGQSRIEHETIALNGEG